MKEENRLKHYAVIERLYSIISKKVNYCIPNCISQEISKYPDKDKGHFGCCTKDYYGMEKETIEIDKHNKILRNKRKQNSSLVKRIEDEKINLGSYCIMHTKEKGCIVNKYKPIICISYFCESFEKNIFDNYGVEINNKIKDFLDRYFFLEDLLKGKLKEKEVKDYEYDLLNVIKTIKEKNKEKEYNGQKNKNQTLCSY